MSIIRRGVRFLLLGLPCLVLVLWSWSYFEVVDLPGFDTLHYPRVPQGGELFIHPRILEGRLGIRYCRVVPNVPIVNHSTPARLGFSYQQSGDNRYQAGTFVEKNFYAPVWFILLITLLYPMVRLARYSRQEPVISLIAGNRSRSLQAPTLVISGAAISTRRGRSTGGSTPQSSVRDRSRCGPGRSGDQPPRVMPRNEAASWSNRRGGWPD